MKKIIIYTLSFFMVFTACKKDETKVQNGNIFGVLQTEDDKVVPNSTVTLSQNGNTIRQDVTDTEGEFTFENIPAGIYQLSAYNSTFKESEMFDYEVKGNTDHQLTFVYYSFISISGMLIDVNNNPITGASITLHYVDDKKSIEIDEVTVTNNSGKFYFYGLEPGVCEVNFVSIKGDDISQKIRVEDGEESIVVLTSDQIEVFKTFIDSRDGKEYNQVEIGEQIWMGKNLTYLPQVDHPSSGSYTVPYYYVYNHYPDVADDENAQIEKAELTDEYKSFGVLYNWTAAMDGEVSSNTNPSYVQGVCPDGWHLPSSAEWNELRAFVEGDTGYGAGKALKSTGTDLYGFAAVLGGRWYSNSTFYNIHTRGYYQTSTESNSSRSDTKYFRADNDIMTNYNRYKRCGYAVRCVKD